MTQWALVTGAAKRLGRAIALELARGGWNIVVHYGTSGVEAEQLAEEIQRMGRSACLAEVDLLHKKPVENLIPSLTREIGPISALINNASLFEPDDLRPDNGRHRAINADAPRILSESFYHALPAGQTGVIANLLDAAPTKPNFSAYNASKTALEKMTIEMAKAFAPKIRINGVALGPVLPSPRESAAHFQALVDATPLKAQTTPEAVAATVRFLIENPYLTGEIIHLDGGAHLLKN